MHHQSSVSCSNHDLSDEYCKLMICTGKVPGILNGDEEKVILFQTNHLLNRTVQ